MNLLDMASYVSGKIRQTDEDSVSQCKAYLRARDEMIYNGELWRESLYQLDITLEPETNALHAAGIYALPQIADRIIAARTNDYQLTAELQETFFRQDYDLFTNSGEPVAFYVMASACWSNPTSLALEIYCASAADAGSKAFVRWIDSNQNQKSREFTLTEAKQSIGDVLSIEDFSKPASTGSVIIHKTVANSAALTLLSTETIATRFVRVRFVEKPEDETDVKLLVKRLHAPLTYDYDESQLKNSSNVLMAFAQGDMLQRARQYGKAKDSYMEAQALLEQLKNIEVVQQAGSMRLIPEPYAEDPMIQQKGYL